LTIQAIDLALTDATLSGGARLASAASGLPQRITTEADKIITDPNNDNWNYGGIAWDPDGLHVWISTYVGARAVKKIRVSDGVVVATVALPSGQAVMGLFRYSSGGVNYLYVGNDIANPMKVGEINMATATVVQEVALTGAPGNGSAVVRVPGIPKIWALEAYNGNTWREYNWPAATATGRTITASLLWATASGTLMRGLTNTVEELIESTLAVNRSWVRVSNAVHSADPDSYRVASTSDVRGLYCDAAGRPWVLTNHGSVERYDAASNNFGVRMFPPGLLQGSFGWFPAVQSSERRQPFMAISDNGQRLAIYTADITRAVANTSLVVRNIHTAQRAMWTISAPGDVTIKGIDIPGALRNSIGAPDIAWSGAYTLDWRTCRAWCTINGSATNFTPGTPLNLAALTGQEIRIEVDMTLLGTGNGPPPWIGGDGGEGPRLWIDDGAVASSGRRSRLYGSM
jgi:hypothetical protein